MEDLNVVQGVLPDDQLSERASSTPATQPGHRPILLTYMPLPRGGRPSTPQ